jgi:hypothetical protein
MRSNRRMAPARSPSPRRTRPRSGFEQRDSYRGHVTANGTEMYEGFADANPVPERVLRAVALAKDSNFPFSVHPATGRRP